MTGITTLRRGSGPGQIALQSELPPTPAQVQDIQKGDRVFLQVEFTGYYTPTTWAWNTWYKRQFIFSYGTGSRIQQYSIEGAAVSRVQCKCLVRFLVAYQFPCDYAGLGFSPYAILWRHAQHHLPNYGREQCLLQSEPTPRSPTAEGSLVGS